MIERGWASESGNTCSSHTRRRFWKRGTNARSAETKRRKGSVNYLSSHDTCETSAVLKLSAKCFSLHISTAGGRHRASKDSGSNPKHITTSVYTSRDSRNSECQQVLRKWNDKLVGCCGGIVLGDSLLICRDSCETCEGDGPPPESSHEKTEAVTRPQKESNLSPHESRNSKYSGHDVPITERLLEKCAAFEWCRQVRLGIIDYSL